jgi:hypothetical protein
MIGMCKLSRYPTYSIPIKQQRAGTGYLPAGQDLLKTIMGWLKELLKAIKAHRLFA